MANEGVIIIKKKKGGGHDGHHGGAWKVAYADFVTAMMAFFLLLWLLNVTTDEQKKGIADYFSPVVGVNTSNTGGQGMLEGQSAISPGPMTATPTEPMFSVTVPSITSPQYDADDLAEAKKSNISEEPLGVDPEIDPVAESTETDKEPAIEETALGDTGAAVDEKTLDEQTLAELVAEKERTEFEIAEEKLRQAIQEVPELRDLSENLIIDQTPEGLRIQIVDQDRLSMFPLGSAKMYDHTRQLLQQIGKVIMSMSNGISITGHTDGIPYMSNSGYSNWELSTDRANASRRALLDFGVPRSRIAYVTGKADQEPLLPEDPESPRNRRISIVLLRKSETSMSAVEAGAQADLRPIMVQPPRPTPD
ncbi:MAG: flagellar motor protein MotB [Alphaproteobacteria bacterium]